MIVGFTGKLRSGKSTAAMYLIENRDYKLASFAKPLKAALVEAVNREVMDAWTPEQSAAFFGGTASFKELGLFTVEDLNANKEVWRPMLQAFGTGVRNLVDWDHWVNKAVDELSPDYDYVFDDVRFLNEAQAIKSRGGLIVRLEAPIEARAYRAGQSVSELLAVSDHPSETEQDLIAADATIDSGRSVQALWTAVEDFVSRAGKG